MKSIADLLGGYQAVFSFFREYEKYFYDDLTKEHILLINILKIVETNRADFKIYTGKKGRPLYNRMRLFHCFIARSILQISTVNKLIDRLNVDRNLKRICGYDYEDKIPDESTFSRAFAEFSDSKIGEKYHNKMIENHIKDEIIGHISRDSTAIESRETPTNKKKDIVKKSKRKRGRPRKDEIIDNKNPSNLEKQVNQTITGAILALNQDAAWGCKKNSQGKVSAWKGYKLHLDVSDVGIPISVVLSGANVHDSQLAIPMEKMTSSKCTYLYSLMDAAYDAEIIHNFIRNSGKIPIIDENKRRKEKIGFDPAKKVRFKIRSTVERCNSHLKDWLFGQAIYVKGHKKVMNYLMYGVICLTAMKILQYGY